MNMTHTVSRWGERTVLRIAFDENTENEMEVILRAARGLRRFEREELVLLFEKVIASLYGTAPDGLGTFRAVSAGEIKKNISSLPFTDTEREMLESVISGMRKRLNPDGIKALKSYLDDIVRML